MLDWESSSLAVPDLSALHWGDVGQEVIEEEHDQAGDVQQEATNSSKNCEEFFPEDFLVSPQEDQNKQAKKKLQPKFSTLGLGNVWTLRAQMSTLGSVENSAQL